MSGKPEVDIVTIKRKGKQLIRSECKMEKKL